MLDTVDEKKKGVHTRYLILLIIFIGGSSVIQNRLCPLMLSPGNLLIEKVPKLLIIEIPFQISGMILHLHHFLNNIHPVFLIK